MSYKVSALFIYPIKSLQGISLEKAELADYGFKYDRQWMLVDQNNQFLSQRTLPKMATLSTHIVQDKLIVKASNHASIELNLNQQKQADTTVTVWGDEVQASAEDQSINAWFSAQLETPCKLVKLALKQKRLVDPVFAKNNERVGFADGFPLLIVSQSSLNQLNEKLETPVNINRFRPNIVIEGLLPHEEDKLQSLIINNIEFKLVKPCSRCSIPAIDQITGEKRPDVLRALVQYRQFNKKIYFGMNALHQSLGNIQIKQTVQAIG